MTDSLSQIVDDIRRCTLCRTAPLANPLPHPPRPVVVASTQARLCIAGQAPGRRVHESGVPFDDPSGDRLRQWLGIDRTVFYDPARLSIVPMGFCFPGNDEKGGDLPPRRECVKTWHDRLFAALPQIELVLVIGQYAQAYHLGPRRAANLTETVRNWRAILTESKKPKMLPLPHPSWRNSAWLRKNPWFESELLPVLKEKIRVLTER